MKGRPVAIVGVGLHPWGVFPDRSMTEMAVQAISDALEDARMNWREVDGLFAGSYLWASRREGLFAMLSGLSITSAMGGAGIPAVSCAGASATGQMTLREAYMAVACGQHDVALAVASDKSAGGFFQPLSSDAEFDQDYMRWVGAGATGPAYWAMECRRRMHELGTTEDDLAMVKVITSKAAALNPSARYRRVFTREEVLNSPCVCPPLRLLEICATGDGAAAVLLCALERAYQYTDKPVIVDAVAVATPSFGDPTLWPPRLGVWRRPGAPSLSAAGNCLRALYEASGRAPGSVDIIEAPDNSSWHYLAYLDAILCAEDGYAEKLLRLGALDPLDGELPVCPSGGIGGFSEAVAAQGLLQVYELTKQLRREAGARQVKKEAKSALSMTYGYAGANAGCIVSKGW